jgi:hypothetical protein
MLRILKFFVVGILIMYSCKKEENEKLIFAGQADSNFIFNSFSIPLKINLNFDSINSLRMGYDSIDIDQDGKYDLIISLKLYNNSNLSSNFSNCNLILKNGLEIAIKKEYYPISSGGPMGSISWADTIRLKQRIDNISLWSTNESSLFLWSEIPSNTLTQGCWYHIDNPEMYIGLRIKKLSQYKYGWIRLNNTSRENILLNSFAIEK